MASIRPWRQAAVAVTQAGQAEQKLAVAYTSIGETIWPASALLASTGIDREHRADFSPGSNSRAGPWDGTVSQQFPGSIAMSTPIAAGPETCGAALAVCLQGLVPTMNRQQWNRRTLGECHVRLSQHQ